MLTRNVALPVVLCIALVGTVAPAAAQYNYGQSSYGGGEGFVLRLEGSLANPRNTDNVVAVSSGTPFSPTIPEWDDEFAGRLGLGYRWGNGGALMVTFWGFEAEQADAGSGSFDFTIGPASSFGADGTAYDVLTEISASTADVDWSMVHEMDGGLSVEWLLGFRFASFEETSRGSYLDGVIPILAAKSNEGTMAGARLGLLGSWRRGAFSFGGGAAWSTLAGEIESSSGLVPPSPTSPTAAALTDDSRSGSILDVHAAVKWHAAERATIRLAWEQSIWDRISEDLMRNLPGSSVQLRDRTSVTFSAFTLGLELQF